MGQRGQRDDLDAVLLGIERKLDDECVPARVRQDPAQVAGAPLQAFGQLGEVADLVLQLARELRVSTGQQLFVPDRADELDAAGPAVHLVNQRKRVSRPEGVDAVTVEYRPGDSGGDLIDRRVVAFEGLVQQLDNVPPPGVTYRHRVPPRG